MLPKKEEMKTKVKLSISNFLPYVKIAKRKSKKKRLVTPRGLRYKESRISPAAKAKGRIQFSLLFIADVKSKTKTRGKESKLPSKITSDVKTNAMFLLILGP